MAFEQDRKYKVLYIHPKLAFGGAEVQRLALLKKWNLDDYKVSVLCIEKIGEIGEQIMKLDIPVYCLDQASKPYNIKATFYLFLFLLRNRFDIVQTCLFNANFHGRIAAFLAGVKLIFSEEHSEHYQYTSLKFIPFIWADRLLAHITRRIICCCDTLKKDIAVLERISVSKLITILSSIDFGELRVNIPPHDLRRNLNLADSDFVIGNISSMSPRKGQDYLLRAFSLVKDKIPAACLVFVGQEEPHMKRKLKDLARKLKIEDKVYFLGLQKESASYYGIMDLFVLPSICEGIPLVILEAMYMGVPVISTNVGGVTEIIRDGETGMLVPAKNAEALGASILELYKDKEKRLRLAMSAGDNSLHRFKPERYLFELEKLYSEFLGSRNN